jgi:WD40 repeat protein
VPVYADARNRSNAFGFEDKAEKRRKVANNDVGIGVRRHGVQMQQVSRPAGTPNTGAEQKLIYANGVPTVQSLNSALKTNGTRMTVSSTMLASEGREISIGQMPEVRSSTAPNAHSSAPNQFNHASMVPRKTTREMELGSSDLEESGWHDADMVSWSFRKSPVKKKKKKKREGSVTHGMPGAPPLAIGGMREPTISIPLPAVDDDGDSVISNPSRSNDYQPMLVDDLDKSAVPSKPTNSAVRPQDSRSGFYTLQEDHLIIYLKEAKNTSWRDIANFFPSRTRYTVQSRYSKILNKRDRSLDPPTWDLPSWYTAKTLRAASTDRNSITHAGLATMEIEEHKEPSTSMLQTTQQRGRPREIDQQTPYELSSKADSAPRKLPGRPPRLPQDPSSGNESAPQRAAPRPRRSAPAVDYTWPRRHRNPQGQDESEGDGVNLDFDPRRIPLPLDSTAVSEEPPETSLAIIPVDEPMVMNFDHQDALLLTSGQKLPYLSSSERASVRQGASNSYWDQLVGREWQGAFIHSDFSHDELATVEQAANALLNQPRNIRPSSLRKGLQRLLRDQPESKLLQLSHEVGRSLKTRDRESIDAFLTDARSGQLRKYPHVERLGAVRPDRKYSSHPKMSISTHVRQRELGLQSRRGWKAPSKTLTYELRNKVLDTLGPAISYTGASSDVHTVAWSPDGQCFAAGAVCVTDDASMQYNRPNNLLYGDVTMKVIHELAEHRIARPKTDSGPNSSHAMYVSQDPFLYTTVAAVAFSPDGEHMYSVGYDSYATIWGATYDGSQPELLKALRHRAEVDLLTVSPTGAVATASKRWRNSVKLMPITGTISDKDSFHSRKADERPDHNILPTALKFEPRYGRLLLAGFGANRREDQHDVSGDICLWDVETRHELLVHGSTKNVFDVAFNPIQREQPLFAVGCVAGSGVNKGTRSTVRFYDYRGFEKYGMIMETESPALDMNDVLYW